MKRIVLNILLSFGILNAGILSAEEMKVIDFSIVVYEPNAIYDQFTLPQMVIDGLACTVKKGDIVRLIKCNEPKGLNARMCFIINDMSGCKGWAEKRNLKKRD